MWTVTHACGTAHVVSNTCLVRLARSKAATSHFWRRAIALLTTGSRGRESRYSRYGSSLGRRGPTAPGDLVASTNCQKCGLESGEPCLAARATGGWCAGHAAKWYEKRPLKPLRRRRTGCDFPGCSNRHRSRGYRAAHYQQLRQGKALTPIYQRKGWYKATNGYVYLWEPDHPNANKQGYVAEHAKVMASMLERPLLPEEEVHHRNRAEGRQPS